MHLSFGELQRTALDALRGLGLAVGEADDCVEALLVCQTLFGSAYALLREADAAGPTPPPAIRADREGIVVDLAGGSLLVRGARLGDYLGTRPPGTAARLRNGIGRGALAYLCHRAARWGATVVARDAAGALLVATPDAASPLVHALPDGDWPGLVAALPPSAAALEGLPDGTIGLLVCDLPAARIPPGAVLHDAAAARMRAIRDGFAVAPADHAYYQSLATRIRVAASERSRSQAG